MNVFIVHAHPEPKSFNSALTACAEKVLPGAGHNLIVSDLYAMNFNPVSNRQNFTTAADQSFLKPQAEEQFASTHDGFAPDIKQEMEKLLWCDTLIFQFPLWWFSLPAILKGWVDRVFAMGFAYGGGRVYETGIFKGKRAMLSLTTGGPEKSYLQGGSNGNMDTILFHIQHGMLYFTGMDVLPPFIAWGPARAGDDGRQEYLNAFTERLLSIETTPPMAFV